MQRIPPPANAAKALDLAHFEPTVNFDKLREQNYVCCFLKATQAAGFVDPTFARRWGILKSEGIVRGAYHFYNPKVDATAQAMWFISIVGNDLGPDDFVILDWEVMNSLSDQIGAREFVSVVQQKLKKVCMVYGPPYFLDAFTLDTTWLTSPLWVAEYGVTAPLVPGPWKNWNLWQYSQRQVIDGVSVPCDVSLVNGTKDDLLALARSTNTK